MRIAVLGAGNAGGALSKAGVAAGHQVVVSAAHPEHAQQVASTAGGLAASSNAEAVDRADVVILAVPHTAVAGIADELSAALTGKVVVDSTNPVNDTYSDLVTTGVSAAEELQRRLPGAHVVKAFNSILAGRHGNPVERDLPLDAFIAGDHAAAKDTVGELATSLGYRAIDAGSLRMARALEEMAFLNISLNASHGWAWQTGWKLVGPTVVPDASRTTT